MSGEEITILMIEDKDIKAKFKEEEEEEEEEEEVKCYEPYQEEGQTGWDDPCNEYCKTDPDDYAVYDPPGTECVSDHNCVDGKPAGYDGVGLDCDEKPQSPNWLDKCACKVP